MCIGVAEINFVGQHIQNLQPNMIETRHFYARVHAYKYTCPKLITHVTASVSSSYDDLKQAGT